MNTNNFLVRLLLLSIILLVLLTGCASKPVEESIFSYSDNIDNNGFWEDVRALDYVNIEKYKSLPIPSDIVLVSNTTIKNDIANIMANYSISTKVYNRPVIDGDLINIDYTVYINGVVDKNASTGGQGTHVTIGEEEYIDGFLEQLKGHLPSETIIMDVTFPKEYIDENLRGKNAVFHTTINYIIEHEEIELTDDFVKEYLSIEYGWKTISEMEEGLRLKNQKQAMMTYVESYLSDEIIIQDVPEKLIEYQKRALVEECRETANNNNMELEEYLFQQGISSIDELLEINQDRYLESVNYSLVAQAIAEDVGITVTNDDLINFFSEYFGFTDYSMFKEHYGIPFLKQMALYKKVVEYIVENAVLV